MKYSFYQKNGYYYVQLNYHGKRVQKSTGTKSKREAEHFADDYIKKLILKQEHASRYSLAFFVENWLEYARLHKRSYKEDIRHSKEILNFFGGKTYVYDITPGEVQQFVYHLASKISRKGTPLSKATINRYIALLKVIFNHSIRMGYLDSNPVRVKKLKEVPRRHFFSEEEIKRLLVEIERLHKKGKSQIHFTFKYIFITALMTGMRVSEILNLKWRDIKGNFFYVRHNKEGVEKEVPIPLSLQDLLLELKDHDHVYIFPMNRRKADAIRNTWNLVKERADVEGRFHDLRRTYAVQLMNQDVSMRVIQSLLGHQNITTTQVYTPANLALKQRVVQNLCLPSIDDDEETESESKLKNNHFEAPRRRKNKN